MDLPVAVGQNARMSTTLIRSPVCQSPHNGGWRKALYMYTTRSKCHPPPQAEDILHPSAPRERDVLVQIENSMFCKETVGNGFLNSSNRHHPPNSSPDLVPTCTGLGH